MSDKNKPSSRARRAGRGFGRLLEKLLGSDGAGRLAESAEVLKREFEEGKREREDPPPRPIPHREVEPGPHREVDRSAPLAEDDAPPEAG